MLKHFGLGEKDELFRSIISEYESETRIPPYKVALAYARAANIYVEVLIDGELQLPEKIPFEIKGEGLKKTKINTTQKTFQSQFHFMPQDFHFMP
ncbi:MAG: hypothetical protein LUM44_09410 [Pyrinomonadaceae bacterium]|nr:hypothetical protein [Pyrinomonadaceae bacterium]